MKFWNDSEPFPFYVQCFLEAIELREVCVTDAHFFFLFFYFQGFLNKFFSELLCAAHLLSEVHWELLVWLNNRWKLLGEAQSCLTHGWFAETGEGAFKGPSPSLRAEPRTSPSTLTTRLTFLDINRPKNICSFPHISGLREHSFVHTDEKSVLHNVQTAVHVFFRNAPT